MDSQEIEMPVAAPPKKSSGELKLFIGILVVALVLVGIAAFPAIYNAMHQPEVTKVKPAERQITRELLMPPGSHIRGNVNAPYSLVEFGDYQCGTCKEAHEALPGLMDKYQDKLRLVYHHDQVASAHTNSNNMAMAAYAAEQQGKFWEMHDKLYDDQKAFSTEDKAAVLDELTKIAANMKLDALKFRSTLTSDAAQKAILADSSIGDQAKVNGTPTFFFVPPKGDIKVVPLNKLKDFLADPKNWN